MLSGGTGTSTLGALDQVARAQNKAHAHVEGEDASSPAIPPALVVCWLPAVGLLMRLGRPLVILLGSHHCSFPLRLPALCLLSYST